jgi:hypothetical protein
MPRAVGPPREPATSHAWDDPVPYLPCQPVVVPIAEPLRTGKPFPHDLSELVHARPPTVERPAPNVELHNLSPATAVDALHALAPPESWHHTGGASPSSATGDLLEVTFLAFGRQPPMGEGMAELMRVNVTQAGGPPATADHLRDPRGRHGPFPAQPQLGQIGPADPQVPVDRLHRLGSDGKNSDPGTLAHDGQGHVVEVHVLQAKPRDLREPRARVDERPQEGRVAPGDEMRPSQALRSPRSSTPDGTAGGDSGTDGTVFGPSGWR